MALESKTLQTTADVLETGCTPTERARSRRYVIELAVATLVYGGMLAISLAFVDAVAPGPIKVAVALLPMVGFLLMTGAMVRFVSRTDEMLRQMFVQAAAIAAGGTAVVTMALGFLENAGLPRVGMTWVWPLSALIFGIAVPIVRRRYR